MHVLNHLREPSRTFENLHRHCLAIVLLLSLSPIAQAVQARAPLQVTPLPQEFIDDITALPDASQEYRLTVKFVDAAAARVQGGSLESAAGWNLKPISMLAQNYGGSFRQRLSTAECPGLNTLVAAAEQRTNIAQPDFQGIHSFEFAAPVTGSQFLAAYNALQARPEIEYVSIDPVNPWTPPSTPDYYNYVGQGIPNQIAYRGPDPGANFDFAHSQGLTGSGMRLSELSPTYDRDHEEFFNNPVTHDLPLPPDGYLLQGSPTLMDNWNAWVRHGAATLSQNLAPPNGFGVTGMTYDATGFIYQTATLPQSGNQLEERYPAAYCNALVDSVAAGPGHVVYWEHQWCTTQGTLCRPFEVDFGIYQLTKTGSDAGVVVLMPAGNGDIDLDTSNLVSQWRDWNDSGSMIVGAGKSDGSQERLGFSTYGQRVGPQGWGQNVVAAGYGDLFNGGGDIHRHYTAEFGGTSSATPMVAGAALLTQQRAISLGLTPLTSREMREFLQRTGIPQGGTANKNIGAFVDLEAAITQVADADLSIVTTTSGTMITTTVTNNGPRTADHVDVAIIYHNPSAHTLVPDAVPATCSFSPQVPWPPGSQCPGQCPSLLECDFTKLAVGASKIIRFDVDSPSPSDQFHIHSSVSDGELQDPQTADNAEDFIVTVGSGGPSA